MSSEVGKVDEQYADTRIVSLEKLKIGTAILRYRSKGFREFRGEIVKWDRKVVVKLYNFATNC